MSVPHVQYKEEPLRGKHIPLCPVSPTHAGPHFISLTTDQLKADKCSISQKPDPRSDGASDPGNETLLSHSHRILPSSPFSSWECPRRAGGARISTPFLWLCAARRGCCDLNLQYLLYVFHSHAQTNFTHACLKSRIYGGDLCSRKPANLCFIHTHALSNQKVFELRELISAISIQTGNGLQETQPTLLITFCLSLELFLPFNHQKHWNPSLLRSLSLPIVDTLILNNSESRPSCCTDAAHAAASIPPRFHSYNLSHFSSK